MADSSPQLLVSNWRQAHKFATVWIALFWGAVSGAYYALPAFYESIDRFDFALLCIGMSLLLVVARITHQPGVE
jgi:hypothetical protein